MHPRNAAEPTSIQRTLDPAAGSVKQEWLDKDTELTLNHLRGPYAALASGPLSKDKGKDTKKLL